MWPAQRGSTPALDLLETVLASSDWADADEPSGVGLIFGLIEHHDASGDGTTLESIGDRLLEWAQSHSTLGAAPGRLIVRFAHHAYSLALEHGGVARADPVRAKASALLSFIGRLDSEEASDEPTREVDMVVALLCLSATGHPQSPPDDQEPVKSEWKLNTLRQLVDIGSAARDRNLHLALSVIRWVREQLTDLGVRARLSSDPGIESKVDALLVESLERMSVFEARMGLDWAAFASAEQAAVLAAHGAAHDFDASRLAHFALERGEHLLSERELDDDRRLALLDRLVRVGRLTQDAQLYTAAIDRACEHLRTVAYAEYHGREWVKAADLYSNLGYRYFAAGEFAGLERLYLLSVFFFEKAEVLRSRAPESEPANGDSEDPNAPEPGYRRFEAEGFIYGASARLTEGQAAIDLFERAASAHERAGLMVFGQLGLHEFYNSAGHFFDAQASLQRGAQASGLGEAAHWLNEAAASMHWCFRMFKQVFSWYEDILAALVEGGRDAFADDTASALRRMGHPNAEAVGAAARSLADGFRREDLAAVNAGASELGRAFVFVNPIVG